MSNPPHIQDSEASTSAAAFDEEWDADYVDESHIQAFARALRSEDINSPDSPSVMPLVDREGGRSQQRVRKVSAVSDFAPISSKVKRRRVPPAKGKSQEWTFHIFRWPMLFILFTIIFAEFYLYVLIRQVVNLFEWLLAWRGRKRLLRKKLRSAKTYEEWKEAAAMMDEYLDFNKWKHHDEDSYYDWQLVRKVRRSLRSLREKKETRQLMAVLEVCMRPNFAGTGSQRLYSETFYGTKDLVENYVNEVESSLSTIRTSSEISLEEKRKFYRDINRNLGASALCLSGGATFGYYSFGVVKAFLDTNMLPRVIAGTSAGGLVAALTCTRTDEELRRLLVPKLADKITACEDPFSVWIRRFWRTGARFDTVDWARKSSFFTRGSMTFREAYERTGRALNISVIPFDQHSPTKLLNYLTAPDCVIWSAIIASAAVPGILNPVVLMQKLRDGSIVPWNWGSKFKDGSLRVDVPLQELNLLFNVNHPIVSQVNPHVHLFFFAPRGSPGRPVAHRKGKGWRGGFFLSAAEQYLKLELTKNFKVIRDLELMPQLLGQDWSGVFLQKFDGSVTIWPKTRFNDWLNILSDPDQKELERKIHVGELVTWPKLHMIENRIRLEREILLGRVSVRQSGAAREPYSTADSNKPALGLNFGRATPDLARDRGYLPIDSDAETGFKRGVPVRRSRFVQPAPRNDDAASIRSVRSLPAHALRSRDTHTPASSRPAEFMARLRSPFVAPFSFRKSPATSSEKLQDLGNGDLPTQAEESESDSDAETDISWLAARAAQQSPRFFGEADEKELDGEVGDGHGAGMDGGVDEDRNDDS